jgi:hypothetical protein
MVLKNKIFTTLFIVIVPIIIAIIIADLMYKFGNYDTPFLLALGLYMLLILLRRTSSKLTFVIVLLFVVCMGFSFIQRGAIRLTERWENGSIYFFCWELFSMPKRYGLLKLR